MVVIWLFWLVRFRVILFNLVVIVELIGLLVVFFSFVLVGFYGSGGEIRV